MIVKNKSQMVIMGDAQLKRCNVTGNDISIQVKTYDYVIERIYHIYSYSITKEFPKPQLFKGVYMKICRMTRVSVENEW